MNQYQRQIREYRPSCEQEERDRQLMLHYIELFPEAIGTRQCGIAHMTASSLIFNEDRRKLLMVYHLPFSFLAFLFSIPFSSSLFHFSAWEVFLILCFLELP